MNNLKEKIEIMKWLYEQGVQPCCVLEHGEEIIHLVNGKGDSTNWFIKDCEDIYGPWYPLEQVLELLPDRIDFGGNMFGIHIFYCSKQSIGFHQGGLITTLVEEIKDNYHLAALKLLKQVIEKNPESVK